MPTNKQRRENERRRLQRQLEQRRQREIARKRFTLIASIVGTLVVIAAVVIVIAVASGGNGKSNTAAGASTTPATSVTPSASATPTTLAPAVKAKAAKGPSVTFNGVTVKGAADLTGEPGVTSKASTAPAKLEYKDLVVGKGAAAKPTSTVTVQYSGVLYKNGTPFDSSWSRGQAASFSLAQVVPGFTRGIGGTTGVPPMKVGGRRIMILPAALGYGSAGQGAIPANSPLVFVVDLTKVSG